MRSKSYSAVVALSSSAFIAAVPGPEGWNPQPHFMRLFALVFGSWFFIGRLQELGFPSIPPPMVQRRSAGASSMMAR